MGPYVGREAARPARGGHREDPGALPRSLRAPHRGDLLTGSRTAVDFDVPVEVAFDYLVDPANRPQWQSSLRRVEDVAPTAPAVGQRWTDVTSVGVKPAMETTALARPVLWAERGTWRGVSAELTLHFRPRGSGCTVIAETRVVGRGPLRLLGPVITAAAGLAIPADLRRAARLLA